MQVLTSNHQRIFGRDLFLVIAVGAVAGLAVSFGPVMELKWLVATIIAIICTAGLCVVRLRERFLFYGSVLLLSVNPDVGFFFEVPSFYRPVPSVLISAFDIVFFLILVSWIARLIVYPELKVRFFPWLSVPFLLIWVISLVGLTRSDTPALLSSWSLVLLLKNWVVFLYVANNVQTRRDVYMVVAMFMASLIIQSIVGVIQYVSGGLVGMESFGLSQDSLVRQTIGLQVYSRVGGTFGHPNVLARYLGLWLPVNAALLFAPLPGRYKVALWGVFAMAIGADFLTFSRGGWISLTLAGGITVAWCLAKKMKHGFAATSIVAAGLVALIVILMTVVAPIQRRILEEDYGAAKARKPLMVVAFNVISHHPLMGVGLGNYASAAVGYDNSYDGITKKFPHPVHNVFLLIAGELGLPALALFLLIIVIVFCHLSRLSRAHDEPVFAAIAIGLFAGIVGLLVALQIDWEYLLFVSRYWFLFGLIQAMVVTVERRQAVTNS
jgi:putative inorganic carbon (hco3(-)) transporter